jgi:hypothetical protein
VKNEANHGDPLCCRCANNYLKGHQRLYCFLIRGAKDITVCMFPQPFQEGRQKQGQGSESLLVLAKQEEVVNHNTLPNSASWKRVVAKNETLLVNKPDFL